MLLNEFISINFSKAYALQQELTADIEMIKMIESGQYRTQLIKDWMRQYGLFQGFTKSERDKIVSVLKSTIPLIRNSYSLIDSETSVEIVFKRLLSSLYKIKSRKWVSATSKILWCTYPSYFIMYDRFVVQAITTLQGLSESIYSLPRIGVIKTNPTIDEQVSYYMRYQNLVRQLYNDNKTEILKQKKLTLHNQYEYEIRIFDKLLWILGNPDSGDFESKNKTCA
jgi:hypothetical protein